MEKKYSITGMTCAACSSGIERTVKKLDGVTECSVSLMGESMDVTFDENVLTDAGIKKAVSGLGYGAYDYGQVPQKRERLLTLGVRFLISLILLLPEMYFAMGHMISERIVPHGWLNYGFQVGLTLAILCVNYQFFVSGVRAAVKLVPNMDTLVTLGAAVSFVYSLVMAIVTPEQPTMFFESAAMIVTLVTLGKWLEDKSKRRTGREIEKLLSLAPDTVTVERNGRVFKVDLRFVAGVATTAIKCVCTGSFFSGYKADGLCTVLDRPFFPRFQQSSANTHPLITGGDGDSHHILHMRRIEDVVVSQVQIAHNQALCHRHKNLIALLLEQRCKLGFCLFQRIVIAHLFFVELVNRMIIAG